MTTETTDKTAKIDQLNDDLTHGRIKLPASFMEQCPGRRATSLTATQRCQRDAGHAGGCAWPIPKLFAGVDRSASPVPLSGARIEPPPLPLYDGLTSLQCLDLFEAAQRGEWRGRLTPVQLAAARKLWSEELRAKVEARRKDDEAARPSVLVEIDEP